MPSSLSSGRRRLGYVASGPELFVVCKKCNSEVSPYITECPYCGTRLRKRAPKLDKGGTPKGARRRERPKLSRLRPGEIPGVRADGPPYATIFLVAVSILVTLFFQVRALNVVNYLDDVVATSPLDGEYWKLITQLFVYWPSTGYEVAALGAIFLFGWLLERRHGAWAPLLVFFLGGLAGSAAVLLLDPSGGTVGANSSALALLAAWSMRDILARRRGEEDDADLLGVLVIAILLVLLPVASVLPNSLAGLAGGLVGILLGLFLARLPQR
jgi:membrane associated rhomboid family serine protease